MLKPELQSVAPSQMAHGLHESAMRGASKIVHICLVLCAGCHLFVKMFILILCLLLIPPVGPSSLNCSSPTSWLCDAQALYSLGLYSNPAVSVNDLEGLGNPCVNTTLLKPELRTYSTQDGTYYYGMLCNDSALTGVPRITVLAFDCDAGYTPCIKIDRGLPNQV